MSDFEPAKGVPPVLQNVRPEDLLVDPTYQRSIETGESATLIRKIARSWDWTLCQPLVVVRRADGSLAVIDGQHRLTAARTRGDIHFLPCVIVTAEGTAEEAAMFVSLNKQRTPLKALDLFRAALVGGNPEAVAIASALEGAGLQLTAGTNYNTFKPGQVSNIGGGITGYRQFGEEATRTALKVLAEAFAGEVQRYCGTIYAGIVRALGEDKLLDDQLMRDVLQARKQGAWMKMVLTERAETGEAPPLAASKVIVRAMAERLVP